jgi:hypothetical protein
LLKNILHYPKKIVNRNWYHTELAVAKLPFYWLHLPRPFVQKPDGPAPKLENEGWQWLPVSWLYYWMVKAVPTDPVNNGCYLRDNGINPDTTWKLALDLCRCHCSFVGSKETSNIEELVQNFREGIVLHQNNLHIKFVIQKLKNHNRIYGIERLKDQALFQKADCWLDELEITGDAKSDDTVATEIIEATKLFFSPTNLMTIGRKHGTITVSEGRHRICAAYKFNVPALPVYVLGGDL